MFRRGPVMRPVAVVRPVRPGMALATGMVVGAAVSSNRSAAHQEQAQYQQAQQAQLAQANAEAAAAQQQAMTSSYQAAAAPQAQAYEVAPPASTSSVGKQMLSEALDGQPSVDDLFALKKQLNVVQIMCDQALGMYRQSMELMNKAKRSNVGGAVIGLATRGVNAIDVAMDAKREAEMKAAVQPAERASQMLMDGFRKIPNALRLRYPTEMSQVGNVPEARLQIGGFGRAVMASAFFGQTGNAVNDLTSARRIRENEEALARCIGTVNEQKQLMAIVQARLDRDIALTGQSAPINAVATPAPAMPPPPPAISSVPPPIMPQNYLEVTAPHIVDEANPSMQQHQIISVPLGARVALVRGDLQGGLGAPYNDYIEVDYQGRIGKISRLVVKRV